MTPVELLFVFVTAPDEAKAAELAQAVVNERLAACGNIIPRIRSIYAWQGKLCDESECLLLLKTTPEKFDALRARVIELHPYEVAEVVGVRADLAHAPYLEWVVGHLRAGPE